MGDRSTAEGHARLTDRASANASLASAHPRVRWLRPRYAQAPNRFHAHRATVGGSVIVECEGRWPSSDVMDELVDGGVVGADSQRCGACVRVVEANARALGEIDRAEAG